jgi:hypothetical protein
MIISDLNVLEAVESTSVIGGFDSSDTSGYFKFSEDVYVKKYFDIYTKIKGNSAFADADAYAYGENSNAQGITYTTTYPDYSQASSTSMSVSD